jgi:hypothetical protein
VGGIFEIVVALDRDVGHLSPFIPQLNQLAHSRVLDILSKIVATIIASFHSTATVDRFTERYCFFGDD